VMLLVGFCDSYLFLDSVSKVEKAWQIPLSMYVHMYNLVDHLSVRLYEHLDLRGTKFGM